MERNLDGTYPESFKRKVCEAYINSTRTKKSVWLEYTGHQQEHGSLLKWLREFGYVKYNHQESSNFMAMASPKKIESNNSSDSFTELQLKKRIADLEKQLKEAELKSIAYSTMVDIAEKEFNLPIRKKYNTKPSK